MFENREVLAATLHGPIHIPGVGQFGPVVTKDPTKAQTKDLKMHLEGNFLIMVVKGQEVILPLSSVSHMRLGPADVKTKK